MNEFLLHHQSFLQALGLAMLQSLGQGFIIFLLLKIVLPLIPGRHANLRYLVSYTALTILFVGFVYTFFTEWQTAAGLAVNANFNPLLQPVAGANGADAVQAGNVWYFSLAPYFSTIRKYLPLVALGYTAGICILCCRMIWQIFKVQLLRKKVIEPDVQLNSLFSALREKVGWSSKVLIKLSDKINVPVVFGHIKPLVLLPVALVTKLDVQQIEAILLHEIGHVKRNDYLFNIIQSVIETLLFFNPFTRWIAANIRTEREHCCDDYVLKHTRQSLPYAYVLLALEEYRSASLSPAMAANGNSKSPLFNRIKRITTMTTPQKKNQRNLGAVTVLVLVAAMICFATAFSQDKKSTAAKAKKSDKNYTEQAAKEKEDTYTEEPQEKESIKELGDEDYAAGKMTADEAMKIARKAMQTASKSMKEIDWNKIANDVEKAGKDIDWNVVNQSLEQAKESIDAIDWKEIQQSMKEAQSSVNWPEIRKAMDEASREVDKAMKEVDEELKNMDDKHSSGYNSGEAEAKADQLRAAALIKQDAAIRRQDEAIRRQEEMVRRQEQVANEGQRKALAKQEEAMRRQERIMKESQERAFARQGEAMRKHNEAIRKHNEAVRKAQENIEASRDRAGVQANRSQSTSDAIVDKLANKGLVKKDGNFKVKLTKAKLIVNGQEQPEAIAREFRNYLESEGQTLTITVKNN
jgi:bla regulator protein BlaR1